MNNSAKKDKNVLKESLAYVKNVVTISFSIIMGMIIIFLLYFLFSSIVASKTGSVPKLSLDVILTGSMAPNINVNDVILNVRIEDPSTIKEGDIITFISSSSISKGLRVTHRVIERRIVNGEYEYITQGDNNTAPDSQTAKAKDLIGKVVLRIPQLGSLKKLLLDWRGWVIIILLPAATIIIYDIIKLSKILKAKKRSENVEESELSLEELSKQEEEKKIEEAIQNIKRSAPIFVESNEYLSNAEDNVKKDEAKIERSIDETQLIILPEQEVIPFNYIKKERTLTDEENEKPEVIEEESNEIRNDFPSFKKEDIVEKEAFKEQTEKEPELDFDEQFLNDAIERMKAAAHQKEESSVKLNNEIKSKIYDKEESTNEKIDSNMILKSHIDRPIHIEQTYEYYGDDDAYFEKPLSEEATKEASKSRIERIVNTYSSEDHQVGKTEKEIRENKNSNDNLNNEHKAHNNQNKNNYNNNRQNNRRRNNRNRNRNRNNQNRRANNQNNYQNNNRNKANNR